MPAFTFEKIAPPVNRSAVSGTTDRSDPSHLNSSHPNSSPVTQPQRGVIIQVLGRFVEARTHRAVVVANQTAKHRD